MLFVLKKIVSGFLRPSSLILLCLGVGLFFLAVKKRFRPAVFLLVCGLSAGLLSFLPSVPEAMLHKLEKQYEPYSHTDSPAPEWILVLGQGSKKTDVPESSRVNGIMYSRLMEAVRIQRETGSPQLIVSISGSTSKDIKSNWWNFFCKNVMVPTSPEAILLTDANDTQAEIKQALQYIGSNLFVLVTSASHMPRAMLIAETLGGKAVAAPCDFEGRDDEPFYKHLIPASQNLCRTEKALHEYLGLLWFRLTHAVQRPSTTG